MNRIAYALTVVLGLFFLVSGIGKILDVSEFRELLFAYGVPNALTIIAAPIPPLEILLGLTLILRGPTRILLIVSTAVLVGFTAAFAYAHFVQGVVDCGCFGRIDVLQTSPTLSFGRNALLISLCIYLLLTASKSSRFVMSKWQWRLLVVSGALAFTLAGASSVQPLYQPDHPYLNELVNSTELRDFLALSPDSTYLIFLLSTNCASCWDAVENVKAYKSDGVVDEIIGLTYGDEIDIMEFRDRFQPNFELHAIEKESFSELARQTPTVYYVQSGVIKHVQVNNVMSAARFYEETLAEID